MMSTENREHYTIFSPGQIGRLTLSNRLVRSATWDPAILEAREMTNEVLRIYERVAAGGVGLIITGDSSVVPESALEETAEKHRYRYEDIRIKGYDRLVAVVRDAAPDCKIVAQISGDYPGVGPSPVPSPFTTEVDHPLTVEQIHTLIDCFVEAIAGLKVDGFDGVQLHAAHGGLLSRFLSPYTNRRPDDYGGSVENRIRLFRDIVTLARERVGDYPILIKANGTDYVKGGIDIDTFPKLAAAIEQAGFDAIEISGGMWDCLVRSEEELGFRPVPAPESHTRLNDLEQQSYFLPYAERVDLGIPVILVGGNRDVERLEEIVREGKADFVALCRPLISEPDLPRRWREGRGSSSTDCISCNACIYDMYTGVINGTPGIVHCVFKQDKQRAREAQRWLSSWVADNVVE